MEFENYTHTAFDKQAYMRDYQRTYNASEKGRAVRKQYRHENSKWKTDAAYLSRPIVFVDGEGVNRRNGDHHYILLAISDVEPIVNKRRLTTRQILDYLWNNLDPINLNVIFGGSYDFNMWVRDLGANSLRRLYRGNHASKPIQFGPYFLKWTKGKDFSIKRDGKNIVIWDILPFFQKSFVSACDEYLGASESWQRNREMIVREKARRGVFTPDEIASMAAYNNVELELGVELAGELRKRLNAVGLRPARWNGPGAIAAALLRREGVKAHMGNPPDWAARAARFAYFGGRFEVIQYGKTDKKCWEYDLNSAYPTALCQVPSLAEAKWIRHEGDAGQLSYALYHVRYDGSGNPDNLLIPAPVPVRHANGTITYPMKADGWIWSPEMEALRKYVKVVKGTKFTVLETIECQPAVSTKPFAFIPKLYKERRALKKAKNGAHIGIKLGLNSLYGKLCQQVGYVPATAEHPQRIPTYHQIEWAGYATSYCRAAVLTAALLDITAVIAFETDALFTSRELPVDIGEELGQFEETTFDNLTYVQSGHYYGDIEGVPVIKCRGVDKGFIDRAAVEDRLTAPEDARYLPAALTRFYGAGIALARGLDKYWCRWLTEPKELALMPSGKRLHGACWCGNDGGPLELGKLHGTFCPVWEAVSSEYPVAWINPNPAMSELDELRSGEIATYDD